VRGPGYTTAVDLGKRKAGVAVFSGTELIHATTVVLGEPPYTPERMAKLIHLEGLVGGPVPHTWVVEQVVLYRHAPVKHKDLEVLLAVQDALEALVGPLVTYTPRQWKGNVPKSVMVARLKEQGLLPVRVLEAGHDALDAVGLGYVHLGVVGRGGARKGP
jgi:hypothetical protein